MCLLLFVFVFHVCCLCCVFTRDVSCTLVHALKVCAGSVHTNIPQCFASFHSVKSRTGKTHVSLTTGSSTLYIHTGRFKCVCVCVHVCALCTYILVDLSVCACVCTLYIHTGRFKCVCVCVHFVHTYW